MTTIPALRVGPVRVHDLDFRAAAEEVLRLAEAEAGERSVVVTPNGQHLDLLRTSANLRKAYESAELVLPDGWPVVLAMKWRGATAGVRVTGADLLPALCAKAAERGVPVGFLGGMPGVAARAAERLAQQHPGLKVELVHSPPVGFERDERECRRLAEVVADSGARLLFLGLGAPKQEDLAHRWLRASGPGVSVCVGAAIDFVVGEQVRAPKIWQDLGMEWAYRMLGDPRRLVGRYARTMPVILRVLGEAGADRVLRRTR
ncbi:N-acetylglucosaminyldiphosphoundecaprenol N-acetyl-beta-D-mannosaminyltransferase [Kutzneria viridogrisea]|uniref:N-acetylglucosaminyldiphosphoundecaprenol N-acetyl-beta-D-mannosaminyltransferase n=1 Tax=Kutzneria viridogrisea TaxID=47990 RepID=A0ABR6BXU7_9PSEU|nr:N-acetylglucosaminyldiphosphoundecaprenol N-acetyl-beta-D-mannosaminyltransferase [Kutzneria viridogrisea]